MSFERYLRFVLEYAHTIRFCGGNLRRLTVKYWRFRNGFEKIRKLINEIAFVNILASLPRTGRPGPPDPLVTQEEYRYDKYGSTEFDLPTEKKNGHINARWLHASTANAIFHVIPPSLRKVMPREGIFFFFLVFVFQRKKINFRETDKYYRYVAADAKSVDGKTSALFNRDDDGKYDEFYSCSQKTFPA